jgi:hypothetical protein
MPAPFHWMDRIKLNLIPEESLISSRPFRQFKQERQDQLHVVTLTIILYAAMSLETEILNAHTASTICIQENVSSNVNTYCQNSLLQTVSSKEPS